MPAARATIKQATSIWMDLGGRAGHRGAGRLDGRVGQGLRVGEGLFVVLAEATVRALGDGNRTLALPGDSLQHLQLGVVVGRPDVLDLARPTPGGVHYLHRSGTGRGLQRAHVRGHQPTLRTRA
jgi:hypothetical protein